MNRALTALVIVCLGLPLAAGCSTATSVTGSITYEGKAIENGAITLLPANGLGPTAGSPIAGGKYRLATLTPGTKLVQIIGVKAVPFARSSEEMARRAAAAAQQGDNSGIIDRADEVPADAVGNNVQVEIKPGEQTLNFDLKKPAAK